MSRSSLLQESIRVIDHRVPHRSTVPAIFGRATTIFLREKFSGSLSPERSPVLLVHGMFSPCTVAFDLDRPSYSWMDDLARHGFDAFALDLTGYGKSERPMMDCIANIDPALRKTMGIGDPPDAQKPSYPFELVTSQTEWDEVGRVVDFICELRGCRKVNLIGWSSGGKRAGGYAVMRPDRVESLILYACANYQAEGPDGPLRPVPYPGYPLMVQNRTVSEDRRWKPFLRTNDQVASGIPDLVWQSLMATDPVGAAWGPGVVRAPVRSYWGWNRKAARAIKTPTLLITGDSDRQIDSNQLLYGHLASSTKVFVKVSNASHFMLWERQRETLHEAAREWLLSRSFHGHDSGQFVATSPSDYSY